MKNTFFLLKALFVLSLLIHSIVKGQSGDTFELQKNSYDNTTNVDIARGNPSINIPLINIPTQSSKLKINVGLNYSAWNISSKQMISDVGLGWNIAAGGSVTRSSHNYVKEYVTGKLNDKKVYNSNMFQYSCPGGSGKFAIVYDSDIDGPKVLQTETSKNRVLLEKTTDTTKYMVKSFTIIDQSGLKYVFDKNDISFYGIDNKKELYQSAFNLTKIKDESDNTIAIYDYIPYTLSITDYRGTQYIVKHKLLSINLVNIGSINFQYNHGDSPLPVSNWSTSLGDRDTYQLQKVILKDAASKIIQQYQINTNEDAKRIFLSLDKQDKNNNLIEKYKFDYVESSGGTYDQYGYPNSICGLDEGRLYKTGSVTPLHATSNVLKTIYLPTGGKIEYEFESNTISTGSITGQCSPSSVSDHCYDSYKLEKLMDVNVDTTISSNYPFSIDTSVYSRVYMLANFDLSSLNTFTGDGSGGGSTNPFRITTNTNINIPINYFDNGTCGPFQFFTPSASNILKVGSGTINPQGIVSFYGIRKNKEPYNYTKGLRVKSIKKYESLNGTPIEILDYNYDDFAQAGVPSSLMYAWENYNGLIDGDFYQPYEEVLYRNVKITNTIQNYSTKYSFIVPDEADMLLNLPFGNNLNGSDLNYNIFNLLLPKKIEQYNGNGQLVQKNEYEYSIGFTPIDVNLSLPKIPWIQNQTVNGFSYPDTNLLMTSSSTVTAEGKYGNIIKETQTDETGDISETTYKFADEMNNQKLKDANIIGTPIQSETKVIKDGVTKNISKSEMKFERPSDVYVSSSVSYDVINGTASTEGTFDKYDAYGNLLQFTSKNGVPVTMVYGYNNTLLIAKVEGITYDQLTSLNIIQPIINASLNDIANPSSEPAMISALDAFRKNQNLKNYNVTTYTYDPLIGVTSETSPMGLRKFYQYDNANRLVKTTNQAGATLQEFKVNLKN